ncbi:MAG: hypothetical protein LBG22_05915 [Treponema sp.]|jgi:hypothetical protein|nr:hypothetical protein [Treponema sp.]
MSKHGKLNRNVFGVLSLCLFGAFFVSCATQYNEKMYADVIGFNDKVYQSYMLPPRNPKDADDIKPIPGVSTDAGKPYDLTKEAQARSMQLAIERVPSGQNTAALYALDMGLDRVAEINKKFMEGDPRSRYYVVFFTDGIDNASVTIANRSNQKGFLPFGLDAVFKGSSARRGNYSMGASGRDAYGNALNSRMQQIIKKYRFFGLIKNPSSTNTFQSYVLLYKGDDLEAYSEENLETMLKPFTAGQNVGAPDVISDDNMEGLKKKFQEAFIIPSFSFSVPKDFVGQRIRMQLSARDQVWFEADVRHQKRTRFLFLKKDFFTLENITVSDGFIFDEYAKRTNAIIEMDEESYDANSNTVEFIINELKHDDKPYSVIREQVTQYHEDFGQFVPNTEYTGKGVTKKNAYILLIMDTSLSLGEHAAEARTTAADIVQFIYEQM